MYVTEEDKPVWAEVLRYFGEDAPIMSITFSESPLKADSQPITAKTPFGIITTEHGIGLQSTRAEVEAVYGQPVFFQDPYKVELDIGDELMRRGLKPLRVARYFLEDPKAGGLLLGVLYLHDEVVAIFLQWNY